MRSRAAHAAAERPKAAKSTSGDRTDSAPKPKSRIGHALERFSLVATERAGSSWAFAVAVAVILAWAVTGPIFHFSDTWQLVINTGTTIVTFLMVFLIQRAQNKEGKAIQLKLNEIVAAIKGASNRLIDVESLSEDEIGTLKLHYAEIAKLAAGRGGILKSHSIEEARARDEEKHGTSRPPKADPRQ
jgi:low affinity Fe/Cu permease